MINLKNYKSEVLSEKLYLKSSTTLFKHEKLLKTNRLRKIITHLNRYKCFERSFSTSLSNRR